MNKQLSELKAFILDDDLDSFFLEASKLRINKLQNIEIENNNARYKDVCREYRKGTISYEQHALAKNQIRNSLLEIIEKPDSYFSTSNSGTNRKQPNLNFIYLVITGVVLVVAMFYLTVNICPNILYGKEDFYGEWKAELDENEVTQTQLSDFGKNGVLITRFKVNSIEVKKVYSEWDYKNGKLLQKLNDGSKTEGKIEWRDKDYFILTIINNNHIENKGNIRHFYRKK